MTKNVPARGPWRRLARRGIALAAFATACLHMPAAHAATLYASSIVNANLTTNQPLEGAGFYLTFDNRLEPPFLFSSFDVGIDDVGQTFEFVADPQSEPEFEAIVALLTDGQNSRLSVGHQWIGPVAGITGGFNSVVESAWFASVLPDGQVDFAGAAITAIILSVSDITYTVESDGRFRMTMDYQWRIEGELAPVPLPAAGWLLASALIGLARPWQYAVKT